MLLNRVSIKKSVYQSLTAIVINEKPEEYIYLLLKCLYKFFTEEKNTFADFIRKQSKEFIVEPYKITEQGIKSVDNPELVFIQVDQAFNKRELTDYLVYKVETDDPLSDLSTENILDMAIEFYINETVRDKRYKELFSKIIHNQNLKPNFNKEEKDFYNHFMMMFNRNFTTRSKEIYIRHLEREIWKQIFVLQRNERGRIIRKNGEYKPLRLKLERGKAKKSLKLLHWVKKGSISKFPAYMQNKKLIVVLEEQYNKLGDLFPDKLRRLYVRYHTYVSRNE